MPCNAINFKFVMINASMQLLVPVFLVHLSGFRTDQAVRVCHAHCYTSLSANLSIFPAKTDKH